MRECTRPHVPAPQPTIHRRAFPTDHLDEDALKVVRRLHRHGYKAYLVGGCVRDLLLGRRPKDFDVATSARPHEVRALFRNCRIIGRRFRLAHILFGGGKVIETATFRRDPTVNADGEDVLAPGHEVREASAFGELDAPVRLHAPARNDDVDLLIRNDNVFGEPHEDALRRDFTINGLFYDVERGEVIDYVGGLRDLERRTVTTIGVPDVRFREDPVRILRAIKFSARLDFGIDSDVYDAMVAHREELRKASKPRVLEEILRLLRGGAAHRSIWLGWETGVLSVVLPQLAVFLDDNAPRSHLLWRRLDAIDALVKSGRVPSDAVLLAALLLGPIEEALEEAHDPVHAYDDFMHEVHDTLPVPRRMKERIRAIIGSQRRLRAGRHGPLARRDFFAEAVQLFELDCAAQGESVPPLHAGSSGEREAAPEGEIVVRRRRRRR
jgi:poly(A) polymerase